MIGENLASRCAASASPCVRPGQSTPRCFGNPPFHILAPAADASASDAGMSASGRSASKSDAHHVRGGARGPRAGNIAEACLEAARAKECPVRGDRAVFVATCDAGHHLLVTRQRSGAIAGGARKAAGQDVRVLERQRAAHSREKRRAVRCVTDEGAGAIGDVRHLDLRDGVGEDEVVCSDVAQDAQHFLRKPRARCEQVVSQSHRIVVWRGPVLAPTYTTADTESGSTHSEWLDSRRRRNARRHCCRGGYEAPSK